MSDTDIIFHIAELRTACSYFASAQRAKADKLAQVGDYPQSMKIDGEADQLENLTYDSSDLLDKLGELLKCDVLEAEEKFAQFKPVGDMRKYFENISADLNEDLGRISGAGEDFSGVIEDLEMLVFMTGAIARRKLESSQ